MTDVQSIQWSSVDKAELLAENSDSLMLKNAINLSQEALAESSMNEHKGVKLEVTAWALFGVAALGLFCFSRQKKQAAGEKDPRSIHLLG